MKKIKTFLALALALSMCVSFAACGDNADGDDEDKAEKKTTATSAAAAEKESDGVIESNTDGGENTVNESENGSSETVSAAESSAESEIEPEVLTHDVNLKEFIDVTIVENCLGHDIDTAGNAITNALEISETVEANEWGSFNLNFPDDLTIGGIHFRSLILFPDSYDNNNVNDIVFYADCDPKKTQTPEETGMTYYNPLRSEIEDIIEKAGFEESGRGFGGEYYLRDFSDSLIATMVVEQNYQQDKDSGVEIPSSVKVEIKKYE